jgi:hypothetical protein
MGVGVELWTADFARCTLFLAMSKYQAYLMSEEHLPGRMGAAVQGLVTSTKKTKTLKPNKAMPAQIWTEI